MRKIMLAMGLVAGIAPVGASAQEPVVVELFTSQGCSSCPPADRLLVDLAGHDYVIALALHVDYWDYLGWTDKFANPQFSARQRRYARAWNERSVYTPQMVIQGTQYMVGSRGDEVQRQIMRFESQEPAVLLSVDRINDHADIIVEANAGPVGEASIYLVRYSTGDDVMIERGENAGQTIHYVNVVQSWDTIGQWGGAERLDLQADGLQSGSYVIIVQEKGQGRIFAANAFTH